MLQGYWPSCAVKFLDVVNQPEDLAEAGGNLVPKKGVTLLSLNSKKREEYLAKMAGFVGSKSWDEKVERELKAKAMAEPVRLVEDGSGEEIAGYDMMTERTKVG